MSRNVKQCLGVLVVAAGFGVGVGTVQAVGAPFQEHEQDYSKNKNYQVGMRDGKDDKVHNRDHFKKRNFKKDEDQRAYESGYQQGHQGDQK